MIEEDLGLTELIKGIKNNGHQEQWSYSWKLANKEGINLKKKWFSTDYSEMSILRLNFGDLHLFKLHLWNQMTSQQLLN